MTRKNGNTMDCLAQGLGWFSVGLGLAEFLAPKPLAKGIGVPPRTGLLRLLGLREILTGVGILTQPRPANWVAARVLGDALDLALLGNSFRSSRASTGKLAFATAAVLGVAGVDAICARQMRRGPGVNGNKSSAVHVRKVITINRPAEELYRAWRNFSDLPRFMRHLESVTVLDERRSHWVAKAPAGMSVEWDAEILADEPNKMIAWRSLEGADVHSSGSVRFEPATGGRGTVLKVELHYIPPAGVIGAKMAKLMGQAPEKQIPVDLMRFKQLMETGEIARTEGQPAGRKRSTSVKFDEPVQA